MTLLWLSDSLGINTAGGMELICLLGTLLSLGVMSSQMFCNKFAFAALWSLYYSMYQVRSGLTPSKRLIKNILRI